MSTIESFINGINQAFNIANSAQDTADAATTAASTAQNTATTAQGTATNAQDSADTAQTTANSAISALATKVNKIDADADYVHQVASSSWGAPTGTSSRASLASYASPVIAATYTQVQIQGVADEVALLSQVLVALIADLKANNSI